ncbi:MAG: hypothetical protein ACI4ML_04555 [Aristaeellaceae bacterium]
MYTTVEYWITLVLRTLLDCVNMYAVCSAAVDEKMTVRGYLLFCALETAVEWGYCLIWAPTYSGTAFLGAMVVVMLHARIVYHRRGRAFLRASAAMLLAQCAFVALCAPVGVLLWGAEKANAIVVSSGFDRVRQSVLNVALTPPTCLIIRQVRKQALRCREKASDILYMLRSVLLLAVAVVCAFVLLNQTSSLTSSSRLLPITISLMAICLMAFVCLSYLIEDFHFLSMRRMNDTLERQKRMTEALIEDTRHFRHNVLNMIYGFEGMLLSEDPELRLRYYRQLAGECAKINNENILNLQRLNHPDLEALLLGKIQQAHNLNIPLFVTIGKLPRIRKASGLALHQAMDRAVDDAIRMAQSSADAHVGVWLGLEGSNIGLRVLCTCDAPVAQDRNGALLPGMETVQADVPVMLQRQGRFLIQTMMFLT